MTEKLVVVLFAFLLVGGAMVVFGPTLAAKYEFAAKLLGADEPVRTLADPVAVERGGVHPFWYVVFALGLGGFFLVFVTPLLFPRARRTRQQILVELAERWPVLTALIDPDKLADENMKELRAIAADAKRFEKHLEQALEIMPSDLARQADPNEATVDTDGVEFDLPPVEYLTGRGPAVTPDDLAAADAAGADPEATQMALPLSQRMNAVSGSDERSGRMNAVPMPGSQEKSGRMAAAAVSGNDEIPFDAVSPAAKPQMAPTNKPKSGRGLAVGGADDSATVTVPGEKGDALIGRVLRESGNFPSAAGESEETIIRESAGWPSPEPDAPTVTRDALQYDGAGGRGASDDTTYPKNERRSDPNATTQEDWELP